MADHANLDSIVYKRNFLKEVIARVDFTTPQTDLAKALPPQLKAAALKNFPVEEPRPLFTQEVELTASQISAKRTDFTEWNFHGEKRDKRLQITPTFVLLSYAQYVTYEKLREELIAFTNAFFEQYKQPQVARLGLRYINSIHLPSGEPLNWSEEVSSGLLGLFQFIVQDAHPTRIFHTYEFLYPTHSLRFQFGMHNPDYPSPIRRKVFILDYDAYFNAVMDSADIPGSLDAYHTSIQTLFERSITDKLRSLMNE